MKTRTLTSYSLAFGSGFFSRSPKNNSTLEIVKKKHFKKPIYSEFSKISLNRLVKKKSLHPTHASCARLAFSFVNFWPPHDFQEDFIFGSHRRLVTFFPKKVDFLFPSFCGEPNRHPKCFPVFHPGRGRGKLTLPSLKVAL